jgi:hypothetical protein
MTLLILLAGTGTATPSADGDVSLRDYTTFAALLRDYTIYATILADSTIYRAAIGDREST